MAIKDFENLKEFKIEGKTLKLLEDYKMGYWTIEVEDFDVIDLGGHTLTGSDMLVMKASGAKTVIRNGTIKGWKGLSVDYGSYVTLSNLTVETGHRALGVYSGSTCIISKDTTLITKQRDVTVMVLGDSDYTTGPCQSKLICNGTVKNEISDAYALYAISGNGDDKTGCNITLTKTANVSSNFVTLFLPHRGTTTVDGATVTGKTAIGIKGGHLDILNSAQISSWGDKADLPNASGFDPTGDAIAICNHNYPAGAPSVTIKDSIVTSKNAKAVELYKFKTEVDPTCEVKSGKFKPALTDTKMLAPYCVTLPSGDVCKICVISKKFYTKDEPALDKSGVNSNLYVTLNYNFVYKNKVISGKLDEYIQIAAKLTIDETSGLATSEELFPIQYKTFADVLELVKPSLIKCMASEVYKFDVQSYNNVFLTTVNKIK